MSSSLDTLSKNLKKIIDSSDDKKPKPYDTQAEVTKVEGDTVWVHIPGGVDATPCSRTASCEVGDVVQVRVSNGRAFVLGNETNPSAGYNTVAPSISYFNSLIGSDITVGTIVACTGYFNDLYANNITAENLVATTGYIRDLTSENVTTENIIAATGYIGNLTAEDITAGKIVADHAVVSNLNANYAHITNGVIDNASIGYESVTNLSAHYAQIDAANIDSATIRESWIDSLMVQSGLIAQEGSVYELDAIQVNASNISAGTLDVERLIVSVADQQDPSIIHKYMVHVDPVTGNPTYQKVDADILEDLTITADKIVAGAITAEKITTQNIVGSGGWINLRNGTFAYENATTHNGITWDGQHLNIRADDFILTSGKSIFEELEAIETWFYSGVPTASNTPASDWTTTKLKDLHLRDIYFDTATGKSYRWALDNNEYKWIEIEDKELAAIAGRVSIAEATIEQHSNNVLIKATERDLTNAEGGQHLIQSLINVAPSGVKIASSKVEIDGTAIFNNSDFKAAADSEYMTYLYDHEYTLNNDKTIATFTAHVYKAGTDITNECDDEQFTWYYKTEEEVEPQPINNNRDDNNQPCNYGKTMPVYISDMGLGGEVVGRFTTVSNENLLTRQGDSLTDVNNRSLQARTSASGNSVRVRDLEYTTTLYPTDGILVVQAEEEKLAAFSTVSDLVDKHFEYIQNVPSATWTVQHNLRKRPSITVIDSAGTEVIGDYRHVDENNSVLTFSGAFSGKAYFN